MPSDAVIARGAVDSGLVRTSPLPSPRLLRERFPRTARRDAEVARSRVEVRDVVAGRDRRLLVVVGPCSIHDPNAALEYAHLLCEEAARLKDDLLIVMRAYLEKPRSTIGWKGLISDPHLDGTGDLSAGLAVARSLLIDLVDVGVPVAVEFLEPLVAPYISDLVSWGAIGARTVESQVHRQLASSLPMPVGMKNRSDGQVSAAIDACRSAARPHHFPGIDENGVQVAVHAPGNPDCHVVLRGGTNGTNYDAASVTAALAELTEAGGPPRLVVDCSHGNSGKCHVRQAEVAADIAGRVSRQRGIVGVMLESFLVAGKQDHTTGAKLVHGQSITDACLDWESTVESLDLLAAAAARR